MRNSISKTGPCDAGRKRELHLGNVRLIFHIRLHAVVNAQHEVVVCRSPPLHRSQELKRQRRPGQRRANLRQKADGDVLDRFSDAPDTRLERIHIAKDPQDLHLPAGNLGWTKSRESGPHVSRVPE